MTALVARSGQRIPLSVDRWHADADAVEQRLIERAADPVLDIGCGPGRVVAACAAAGRPALGIDTAPDAVAIAQSRGAAALCRSVFARLPGEGRWGTAVLLDGNIGIGGDPDVLLRRVAELLRPGGGVVVELGRPGSPTDRLAVRIEADGRQSPWFGWARVAVDAFAAITADAGLISPTTTRSGDRWFGMAQRP